jgi:hypothetical protein
MDENPYKSPETGGEGRRPSLTSMAAAVLHWIFAVSLIIVMVVAGVAALMAVIYTFAA